MMKKLGFLHSILGPFFIFLHMLPSQNALLLFQITSVDKKSLSFLHSGIAQCILLGFFSDPSVHVIATECCAAHSEKLELFAFRYFYFNNALLLTLG